MRSAPIPGTLSATSFTASIMALIASITRFAMLSTPLIIMLMIPFISAQMPSHISFVLLLTVSHTPVIASRMAVNFSSTAVLMVSQRVDRVLLIPSQISEVVDLMLSQIVLIAFLIAVNRVVARDFSQFQMVLSRDFMPFQMVVVILEIFVHTALMVAYIVLTAAVTMPFKISHMPRKISLIPSQAIVQSAVKTPTTNSMTPLNSVISPSIIGVTTSINPKTASTTVCKAPAITGATLAINHSINGCRAPVHN